MEWGPVLECVHNDSSIDQGLHWAEEDQLWPFFNPIKYRSPWGVEGNAPFEVSKHKVRFLDPSTVYPAPPTHSTVYDEDYSNLKLHCD